MEANMNCSIWNNSVRIGSHKDLDVRDPVFEVKAVGSSERQHDLFVVRVPSGKGECVSAGIMNSFYVLKACILLARLSACPVVKSFILAICGG